MFALVVGGAPRFSTTERTQVVIVTVLSSGQLESNKKGKGVTYEVSVLVRALAVMVLVPVVVVITVVVGTKLVAVAVLVIVGICRKDEQNGVADE